MADENRRGAVAVLHWEGDSLEVLRTFPDPVKDRVGYALYQVQQGNEPSVPSRRMESIGPGVYELKEVDRRAWYRVIYLARVQDVIYVLHCFEKQSRKTDARDLNLARQRLANVRRRLLEVASGKKKRE